jgi:soluble lytic murein transglycosylase-like protein
MPDNRPFTIGDALSKLSDFYTYLTTSPKVEQKTAISPEISAGPSFRYAPKEYWPMLTKAANTYGIDPRLSDLLGQQESNWIPTVRGSKGEYGIMQIMPKTAKELGMMNPMDVEQNIMGGTRYLAHLLKATGGDLNQAYSAYNAGLKNTRLGSKAGQAYAQRIQELAKKAGYDVFK